MNFLHASSSFFFFFVVSFGKEVFQLKNKKNLRRSKKIESASKKVLFTLFLAGKNLERNIEHNKISEYSP